MRQEGQVELAQDAGTRHGRTILCFRGQRLRQTGFPRVIYPSPLSVLIGRWSFSAVG